MSAPRVDILIAGGGVVGLSLALAVATGLGAEVSVKVVDPVVPGREADDARALAVSAASKHLLDAVGAWPALSDHAQRVARIELTDSPLDAGIRPVLLTYDNTVEHGEPASYILPADVLAAELERLALRTPGIEMLRGEMVTSVTVDTAGATVTLASGSSLTASLVVAADGRRSRLREAAGIKTIGWAYGQTGMVTRVVHERPHGGVATQHFLPSGPFAILPMTDRNGAHRSCITWSEEAGRAREILALPDEEFLAEVDMRFGGKLGPLALDGPRQSWPLDMHLARAYVAPRLALVGDAAHGVHPIAGQGLNLAMRDVAALTECIADAMRLGLDAGDATALARYQRWRRFDSAASTATFDGLNRLFSRDGALLRSAREAGLSMVDRLPGLKRLIVSEAAGLSGDVPKLLRGELV